MKNSLDTLIGINQFLRGDTMKRFKNILLFADPNTDVAVSSKWALTLAKQNHARLTVVDVVGLHIPAPNPRGIAGYRG
jgi:hypothetical protein